MTLHLRRSSASINNHYTPKCRPTMTRHNSLLFWKRLAVFLLFLLKIATGEDAVSNEAATVTSFGVDVSFPMQHAHVSQTEKPFSDSIMPFYNEFMQGCRDYYQKRGELCDESERARLNLNLLQPAAMQNYTSAGYAKVQLPQNVMKLLVDFWENNQGEEKEEQWPAGNTYVNHWKFPTYMLSIGDRKLKGGGSDLKRALTESIQPILEAWTGQSLVFTSAYGVRIYKNDAVLSPHIDRLPLVTSAIVNVAQDVDEPWPLEVIGHDGKATNITLKLGEMILYESQSVIHGRPYPLKGRYYANVFLHFEPHGHTERHNTKEATKTQPSAKERYEKAVNSPSPPQPKHDLPEYIKPGSEEETKWRQQYIFKAVEPKKNPIKDVRETKPFVKSEAHAAAAKGDLFTLKQLAKTDAAALLTADRNGWKPIHEASRAGEVEAVEFLIKQGAEVNERTNNKTGGTPLWWAEQLFEDDHPVVRLLQRNGAVNIGPDFVEE